MARIATAVCALMVVGFSSAAAQEFVLRLDGEMLKPPAGVAKALDFFGFSGVVDQLAGEWDCEEEKQPAVDPFLAAPDGKKIAGRLIIVIARA